MKKLLVVIDMQNDFIDGALGTPEAREMTPRLVKYINEFDGCVIATLDTHHENYLETLEGKKLPVMHCVEGTDGWRINDSVMHALMENKGFIDFIRKPTFGSFALIDKIADIQKDIDHIEIAGLCTDICIASNALILRAAFPDMLIAVHGNLCAGVTPESHEAALATMRMCQIDII
jgi:nicotinamidase-related amidase